MADNRWQFWVDRGGTFTDVVARQPDGSLLTRKLLSENPEQYRDAAVQGIRDLLQLSATDAIPENTVAAVKMGTTVATNALLERKGDRTLLLITRGFGDLLRIGYQVRPALFELNVVLPELLYESVAEVNERLDEQGNVLQALDETSARAALQSAYDEGIRGVAIALMHGYRNPQHEARLEQLALDIGFTQVSVSHRVSPLMKLVSRGDTTVTDAYLSPILRRYVEQVRDALGNGCERLLFMQSNGGLTDASLFQGKDAILSGPAGGVVGMVRTGLQAGHDKLIGFDMGGTSTDVCHYAGEYERSFETEVAGVRMRAPMMNIHTVAAGGGSILKFSDGRFQVGPDSAGANPGPACYRRGGPLTVTDCNVMLGKLQAAHFPAVFGPKANELLDTDVVVQKFNELAKDIAAQSGKPVMTAEAVAEGFLRIAIENMANAIKKISVQRGYDVTRYTLNCFGGAGGQHACGVADALGMKTVLLHPFAGVLSAYGMGLADIRALREAQFEQPLSAVTAAADKLESLATEARAEVLSQGVEPDATQVIKRVHLRYPGSFVPLQADFGTEQEMRQRFEAAHIARYGFSAGERELVIEAVAVEAVGATETPADTPEQNTTGKPQSHDQVSMYSEGEWKNVSLYRREDLLPGMAVQGPAIISESTATTIVEAGWRATVDGYHQLCLTRTVALEAGVSVGTDADPVMLEVFNNLYMNIAEQMGATLANTAYSVNIKERLDFSCALFDTDGRLVANAPHVPVHLGSMSESILTVIRLNSSTMQPGDVYMLNAPFNGGTHLPDVTVVTPVWDEAGNEVLFYVASRGHHADIGGRTPGSAPPDSSHIDEEGVLIDNFQLVDRGVMREAETRALLASGPYPCRNIDENMADLAAQVAANETGAQEVRKMVSQFGLDVVRAYMQHVQDNAEECVRRAITALHDGQYRYELDSGAVINVALKVDRENRTAVIDFTGTSDKDKYNYNAPFAVCRAVVLYVFRTLVPNPIPLNEGCFKPLTIIAPQGSMINAEYPSAVIAGNTEVSQAMCNALIGALGVLAGSQATMNNFVWGNERIQNYETICGGMGAGAEFDGCSAIQTHMTNTRSTDPEVLEWRFPVRLEEFSIRHGSGGAGKHNGGSGITRKMRFLEPMTVTVLGGHRRVPPFGVDGGEPGEVGLDWVERADGSKAAVKGIDAIDVEAGDMFIMQTPGGGGYGRKN
jgi:5-oxoprolinase (ATP-hydrolysing)